MNNHEFCAQWAAQHGGRVLDYGCGAGQIVGLLRSRGVEAFGCDVFYEGGSYEKSIPENLRPFVSRMADRIPFPDSSFDVVVSNTVLEHVPDLSAVLAEIRRVLKPGGATLNVFPHLEVWREGHCGVPFLHRFPKRSVCAVYYAAAYRWIGLGSFPSGRTPFEWAQFQSRWLAEWTHYRPLSELRATFARHFSVTEHIEGAWMKERFPVSRKLPSFARRWIARKAAGLVLVSH